MEEADHKGELSLMGKERGKVLTGEELSKHTRNEEKERGGKAVYGKESSFHSCSTGGEGKRVIKAVSRLFCRARRKRALLLRKEIGISHPDGSAPSLGKS